MSFNELEDFEFPEEPQKWIRVKCPACRQKTGVEVSWGFPTREAFEAAERGDLVLTGCSPPLCGEEATRQCTACDHKWGGDFGPRGRPLLPKVMTASQQAALKKAYTYVPEVGGASRIDRPEQPDVCGISINGLTNLLASPAGGGFSATDARFAAEHVFVNWNDQADVAAQNAAWPHYYPTKSEVIAHLTSEAGGGFTKAQARHAAIRFPSETQR